MMVTLADYGYNRFSQFGEDGMIAKAFEILGPRSKICIEFGAWDGLHFSNTANLWQNGWKAILIETNRRRFARLVRNTAGFDCHCIRGRVGYEGRATLEAILARYVPELDLHAIDLLSIDVDGDDYHIMHSLDRLRPRLLICEYNPTIPIHMELVPPKGNYFGCSALSLVKLAETKGYKLIAMTNTNGFFVSADDWPRFAEFDTRPESLFDPSRLTYLLSGYDGRYLLSQSPIYGFSSPARGQFTGECYVPRPRPVRRALWHARAALKRLIRGD